MNIDNFRKVTREKPSEYQIQKIKLEVYKLLLDYCQETQSTLIHTGSDEFFDLYDYRQYKAIWRKI